MFNVFSKRGTTLSARESGAIGLLSDTADAGDAGGGQCPAAFAIGLGAGDKGGDKQRGDVQDSHVELW